ncbi:hypothetical protein L7F22_065022 [Adiantum nelumboides]|nr:hypothetical protein [Adiantum nelumboides]
MLRALALVSLVAMALHLQQRVAGAVEGESNTVAEEVMMPLGHSKNRPHGRELYIEDDDDADDDEAQLTANKKAQLSNIKSKKTLREQGSNLRPEGGHDRSRRHLAGSSWSTPIYTTPYGHYVTKLLLGGSPNVSPLPQTVLVDTGSDLTWVQCLPSVQSVPQEDPLYDPIQRGTFKIVKYDDNMCQLLPSHKRSPAEDTNACMYTETYNEGTTTWGTMGLDNVGLGSWQANDVLIGCGAFLESGVMDGEAGILALGQDRASIITGVFLDSGTSSTRFPLSVYIPLRDAIRRAMAKSGYNYFVGHYGLETCYNFPAQDLSQVPCLPIVELLFEVEVLLQLDTYNLFKHQGERQWCLMFRPQPEDAVDSILGNNQLHGFQWSFDLLNQKIGFLSGACVV